MFSSEEIMEIARPFTLVIRTNGHSGAPRFYEELFETRELAEAAIEAFKATGANDYYTVIQTENIEE